MHQAEPSRGFPELRPEKMVAPCEVCGKCTDHWLAGGRSCCEGECADTLARDDAALLAEPISEMPEELVAEDIHRWARKFALHANRMARDRGESPPVGVTMAQEYAKELIVRRLPSEYVTIRDYRGHDRWIASGTYEVLKPIPRAVFTQTLLTTRLVTREPPNQQ